MAGTPTSKILEMIEAVAQLQAQFAILTEAVEKLTLRVERIEQTKPVSG